MKMFHWHFKLAFLLHAILPSTVICYQHYMLLPLSLQYKVHSFQMMVNGHFFSQIGLFCFHLFSEITPPESFY